MNFIEFMLRCDQYLITQYLCTALKLENKTVVEQFRYDISVKCIDK
jgi:hypothetical protein